MLDEKEMKDLMIPIEYGRLMEHEKWIKEIPYLDFKRDWRVQVSPPFAGAVVRFRVKRGEADVSVYLDCYDKLGYFGSPYWEVYPYNDDTFRCGINETEELIKAIEVSLKEQGF